MSTKVYWYAMVILAFGSIISFFQIGSYGADKNHTNTLFTVIGIITGLIAVFCLYQVAKKWGGGSAKNK